MSASPARGSTSTRSDATSSSGWDAASRPRSRRRRLQQRRKLSGTGRDRSGRGQRSRSKLRALDGRLAVMLRASRNIASHRRCAAFGVSWRPSTSGDADAIKRVSTADRTSTRSACRSSPHADESEAAVAELCARLAAPDAGFGVSDSLSGRHGHQDLGVAVHPPDERSSRGRPRPSRRVAADPS